MSAPRSKQLYAGQVSAIAVNNVYTVPTATITIIKSVAMRNPASGYTVVAVGGSFPAGGSNRVDILSTNLPGLAAGGSMGIVGQWVLNPGDGIEVNLQIGGPIQVWVSGVELT